MPCTPASEEFLAMGSGFYLSTPKQVVSNLGFHTYGKRPHTGVVGRAKPGCTPGPNCAMKFKHLKD